MILTDTFQRPQLQANQASALAAASKPSFSTKRRTRCSAMPQLHATSPSRPDRSGDQCRSHCSRRRLDRRSARYRGPDVYRRLADSDADVGMAIAFRPTCLPRLKSRAAHAAPGRHRQCADRSRLGLAHQVGFLQRSIERRGPHDNVRSRGRDTSRCAVCRRSPRRCHDRSATGCCRACPGCKTSRDRSDGAGLPALGYGRDGWRAAHRRPSFLVWRKGARRRPFSLCLVKPEPWGRPWG